MTGKRISEPGTTVRFDSLDAMPPAEPLSPAFKALSDEDVAHRALQDPDAGTVPDGFWDRLPVAKPEAKEQITLRLDPEVLRHFRSLGKGYQSRINAVLRSYVRAKGGAG
ncbi:BrnA antitoxin family protein [Methylobacterium sp. Leaf117]|uniref:BrnA antitoxin family protein n=2 Tax=unclassified Methylobacterium TaxID=2615210 RepID=UPI001FCDABAF|nr:BrnA antitoxin family protein [Methylobacterium sp. Leaf117]